MVNDVSNWYVRRSRRRLWDESNSLDKVACQLTLHEVLTTVCRLVAPVSPFMVDEIHHNLTGSSVHTADWPTGVPGSLEGATADAWDESAAEATATLPPRDPVLESTMTLVRELAEAGRRIRIDAGRRQRLPCGKGWIVAGPDRSAFHEVLAEELNVEAMLTESDLDRFQRIELAPNFRSLAPKARANVNEVAQAIRTAEDPLALLEAINNGGADVLGVLVESGDVEVKRVERVGFAAQTVEVDHMDATIQVSLVLDLNDSPALLSKGMARDITRRVQAQRKAMDLALEATIDLEVWLVNAPEMMAEDEAWVAHETRAAGCVFHPEGSTPPATAEQFEVDGTTVHFTVA